jgi:hypothetical protein
MNAKTSKLIRKFARRARQPYDSVKRLWNSTPERYRCELRCAMEKDANGRK